MAIPTFSSMVRRMKIRTKIPLLVLFVFIIYASLVCLVHLPEQGEVQIQYREPSDAIGRILNVERVDTEMSTQSTLGNSFPLHVRHPDRVFFNRVPKCASTGLKKIFNTVMKTLDYNFVSSPIFAKKGINRTEQEIEVQTVMSLKQPLLYERHLHFLDFTRFGEEMPLYINVIRDPYDRLVSDYYFRRFHLSKMFNFSQEYINQKFDDCVLQNMPECVEPTDRGYFQIIPFFCGQDEFCRNDSDASLHQAKKHVELYYGLVGVMEDIPAFLHILEHILPTYFTGAAAFFEVNENKMKSRYETKSKPEQKSETIQVMKKLLRREYEFYHFVHQRFYNTWHHLRAKSNVTSSEANNQFAP